MEYKMICDNSNYDKNVVMANDIIKGKQEMTLQEARFLRLIITQIVKDDVDFRTYSIDIKDLANFLNLDSSNIYRTIRDLCKQLLKRTVDINTGNPKEPWESFQWLNKAKYDGKGMITIKLSEDIKPYLLSLNSWFTKYKLKGILHIDSFYAIRFYELIKMKVGINSNHNSKNIYEFEFTIEYLKSYFCCQKKFERISNFKSKVIDICIKEINEKTDLLLDVEYIKTGRAITSIRFFVQEKEVIETDKQEQPPEPATVDTEPLANVVPDAQIIETVEKQALVKTEPVIEIDMDDLADSLRAFIKEPLKTKELKEILEISSNNIDIIMNKYAIYQLHDDIKDLKTWLIWAIETDYKEAIKDIDDLCDELRVIISEPLSTKDLKAILLASNNNVKLIKSKYTIAKKQGNINNLTAFLIAAIKKDFSEPIEVVAKAKQSQNKFINYTQHVWDFEDLAKKDEEYLIKNLERKKDAPCEASILDITKTP